MKITIPVLDTRTGVRSEFLGLGFEKLDRDLFDPTKAYPFLPATGVSWIRLQSGWQRTEREKGIYDFAWLDKIVDSLVGLGLKPWMCLCYGNALYGGGAEKVFGAVGVPPIATEEQRRAWRAYVTATVAHFRGRVAAWEVWNEPDGQWCWKHGPSGTEYGRFVIETAAAARAADPEAKIVAGSMCMWVDTPWFHEVVDTGALDDVWGFTYHQYTDDERSSIEKAQMLEAMLRLRNPDIRIIQGESGSQSRPDGNGALKVQAWTPRKQARQLLRHAVADLLAGVEFSSYFSCLDMVEALNGATGDLGSILDYGYFGVLGAEFGPDGRATGTYSPKLSYHALAHLAAILRGSPRRVDAPVQFCADPAPHLGWSMREPAGRELVFGMLELAGGARGLAYWNPTPLHTVEYNGTATVVWRGVETSPLLADPLAGTVEPLPESSVERLAPGVLKLHRIPLRDTPLFLLAGLPWKE
ncbi:MAG: hypothetical protein IKH04_09345 [Kiritimatiellae bacterium]|nr:hypothetical protein [Kiritimatiellia bacterium]